MLLSDKDTQIAVLEMAGAKTQYEVERLDHLHSDRKKMNHRLKVEVSVFTLLFFFNSLFFQSGQFV